VHYQVKEPAQHGGVVAEFIVGYEHPFGILGPIFGDINAKEFSQNIIALQQRFKILQGAR